MTHLRQLMLDELQRRNYSQSTHLQAIPSPLEAIEVSRPDEVKRSRRLMKR